jgi:hypothetical protein
MLDMVESGKEVTLKEVKMKRWCIVLIVILAIISLSGCGVLKDIHATYANYRGEVVSNYMVQDARNRILSYDWYYDQYGQIQAQIANVESLQDGDDTRGGMIRVINSMIGEYNSKSRQYNHAMWKADDLPYELEMYKGDER